MPSPAQSAASSSRSNISPMSRLRRRALRPPQRRRAPSAERAQATAPAPRPRRRHPQGARPSLPAHLRHLGHRPRRPRARCPAPARPQFPGDGAPLQRDLWQRPGGGAPRRLLPRRRHARRSGRRGSGPHYRGARAGGTGSSPLFRSRGPDECRTNKETRPSAGARPRGRRPAAAFAAPHQGTYPSVSLKRPATRGSSRTASTPWGRLRSLDPGCGSDAPSLGEGGRGHLDRDDPALVHVQRCRREVRHKLETGVKHRWRKVSGVHPIPTPDRA